MRRVGRRPRFEVLATVHHHAHRPWIATAVSVAVLLVVDGRAGVTPGWQRAVVIAVVTTTCWLIVAGLAVAQHVVESRLPIDVEDNRRVRRVRTQVLLLKRVAVAVVVVLGFAAVLMTFPGLRTFGASLLASAGLAGVVAGLAAQTTLGNVFAGLQLAFTDALRVDDVVVVEASPLWAGRDWVVQVVDTTETTMVVRVLASAYDAPTAWDLRCDVREELLAWLRAEHPQSLPTHRSVVESARDALAVTGWPDS